MKPSAAQIEARFSDWWLQVGRYMEQESGEIRFEYRSRVAHEAFQAGAAYVITHAGLNQTIAAETGDHCE